MLFSLSIQTVLLLLKQIQTKYKNTINALKSNFEFQCLSLAFPCVRVCVRFRYFPSANFFFLLPCFYVLPRSFLPRTIFKAYTTLFKIGPNRIVNNLIGLPGSRRSLVVLCAFLGDDALGRSRVFFFRRILSKSIFVSTLDSPTRIQNFPVQLGRASGPSILCL